MNQVQYCNSYGGMPKHSCLACLIFFSRKNLRALFRKMWLLIIQHPIIDTVSINSWSSWMSPGDISKTYSWWTLLQSRTNFDTFQCEEIQQIFFAHVPFKPLVYAKNEKLSSENGGFWKRWCDCLVNLGAGK